MSLPYRVFALAVASFSVVVACSEQAATRDRDRGRESDDEGDDDAPSGACELPKVQTLSEPCCKAHGADACGAGLFCAALDGRTESTCYANRSRIAGQTCDADEQCATLTCSDAGFCAALPLMECKPAWGCTGAEAGGRYVCVDDKCQPVGSGYCLDTSDCGGQVCVDSRCKAPSPTGMVGAVCTVSGECASGNCFEGKCSCSKSNGSGCPANQACTGGSHPSWGTTCGSKKAGGEACLDGAECVGGQCVGRQCVGVEGGSCVESAGCSGVDVRCLTGTCQITNLPGGATCTVNEQCFVFNCFQNVCSCDKRDNNGCPGGQICSGGGHAIWGNTCSN